MPTRSLRLVSPQVFTSSYVPACHQRGLKDPGATRPGVWRWLPEGELAPALGTDNHALVKVFDKEIDFPSLSLCSFPISRPLPRGQKLVPNRN